MYFGGTLSKFKDTFATRLVPSSNIPLDSAGMAVANQKLCLSLVTGDRYLCVSKVPGVLWSQPSLSELLYETWFSETTQDGIVHMDLFNPVPTVTVALMVTAIHLRIDEWQSGTCKTTDF